MNAEPAPIEAAQDAYQAWLRARSLAVDAARAFLARFDAEARAELEAMLEVEAKQRAQFEALAMRLT